MNKRKEKLDLTGFMWGTFVVIGQCEPPKKARQANRYWECLCACGEKRIYPTSRIKSQKNYSCGCVFKKENKKSRGENKFSFLDDYVKVTTANGYSFIFDYEDYYNSVNNDIHWYIHNNTSAKSDEKYVISKRKDSDNCGKAIKLHNYIMNPPDCMIVDHIDGDTMNNTRKNLRIVTPQQNAFNKATQKNNTSGHKGVCFVKRNKKWTARIGLEGKRIVLGTFDSYEEAVKARIIAEIKYYGEYSRQYGDKTVEDINID